MYSDRFSDVLTGIKSPYMIEGVGIPASGKSTALISLANELDLLYVCPDNIREELTGSMADQSVNAEAWSIAKNLIRRQLRDGGSLILDATNTIERFRRKDVQTYRKFGAQTIVAAYFPVELEVAKQRNQQRNRIVPEEVLERMHRQLTPPSLDEGFDIILDMTL